jgi:Fe-S-cluster containining protein
MGRNSHSRRQRREKRADKTRSRLLAWAELQKLYDQVPPMTCKGKCTKACGMIPLERIELEEIKRRLGRRFQEKWIRNGEAFGVEFMLRTDDFECPMLVNGRCSVYDIRPMICRLYGIAEGMPCGHDCACIRAMSDAESKALLHKVEKLSDGLYD